jgi:hypothetical protein
MPEETDQREPESRRLRLIQEARRLVEDGYLLLAEIEEARLAQNRPDQQPTGDN